MSRLSVSIVIATHGPAPYIGAVLQAIAAQTYGTCEVVIVDNNRVRRTATDPGTGLLNSVKVVHEREPGLSRARNTGISVSRGDIVAFIDDDAVPEKDWVAQLVAGIKRYKVAVAGGTVELALPHVIPHWFTGQMRSMLSELTYDRVDIPAISLSQYIVGANMCVARSTLDAFGGFNLNFGRVAAVLRSSEELEFCRRLQRVGQKVSFLAGARVWHQISGARLSRRYLFKRAYWQGRSDALLEMTHGRPLSFGSRTSTENLKCSMRALRGTFRAPAGQRLTSAMRLVREAGYMFEFARQTRTGSRLQSAEEMVEADANTANRAY